MQILQLSIVPDWVCREHGIHDVLPCPWPGCSAGHPEDRFQAEMLLDDERPYVYSRRQWRSPIEGSYYSWECDRLSNWLSAATTITNESRRLGLTRSQAPKHVYHYTSLESFVAIVQSRSLWLSDYSYLNDKRELTYGADMVRKVAGEMVGSFGRTLVVDLLRLWIQSLGDLGSRVCIASFSAEEDSLGQWRSYGPLALGFEPQNLSLHVVKSILRPIEYDRRVQEKLVAVYLHHLCQAYELDSQRPNLEQSLDLYRNTERLIELIAFFKDPSFRTEEEYRLAYIENPEVLESVNQQPTAKRFRISRSKILPYVSSVDILPSAQDRKALEISEVVLGPESSDLVERGVREFLVAQGLGDVTVRRSEVPYRP